MNWVKSNPFLAAFLAVVIVGLGILGYLLNNAYAKYSEVSEQYDSQVAKLQQLQNRRPFPNDENIAAYTAQAQEYKTAYEALLEQLLQMQYELETITPQAFQDRLRAVVSEVEAGAAANGVTLPEDFYMGFGEYQGRLPSDQAAGPLARQLAAIKTIVDRLIEYRATEIVSITRKPLPEEVGETRTARPTPTPRGGTAPANRQQQEPASIAQAFPFDIQFVSEQGRLRQVLNAIVTADRFFIIRNLTVASSQVDGPPRVDETNPQAETPSSPLGDAEQTDAVAGLNVIVGRELLTVSATIEMLTFTLPEPQATPSPRR